MKTSFYVQFKRFNHFHYLDIGNCNRSNAPFESGCTWRLHQRIFVLETPSNSDRKSTENDKTDEWTIPAASARRRKSDTFRMYACVRLQFVPNKAYPLASYCEDVKFIMINNVTNRLICTEHSASKKHYSERNFIFIPHAECASLWFDFMLFGLSVSSLCFRQLQKNNN